MGDSTRYQPRRSKGSGRSLWLPWNDPDAIVHVDRRHARAAALHGLEFGEDVDLELSPTQVNQMATDALNEPLNDMVVKHGDRRFRTRGEWTPKQSNYLMTYKNELARIATIECVTAIMWRRGEAEAGYVRPVGTPIAELRETKTRKQLRKDSRRGPAPEPQPYGVSHEGAEGICAEWMRHLGALDATVTSYSKDGGIDILARISGWAGQVKNYAGSVGVVELREFVGACSLGPWRAVMFTSGEYTLEAQNFADEARIALFRYDVGAATLVAINGSAKKLKTYGFRRSA